MDERFLLPDIACSGTRGPAWRWWAIQGALLWFCLGLLATPAGAANGEGNIWYFGYGAGLDFNSGSPVALHDGQINQLEGCATIADSDGNLLFYTDGMSVWNCAHGVMPNGTGLSLGRTAEPDGSLGVAPNELTDTARRDFLAGTPWHKHVPARLG